MKAKKTIAGAALGAALLNPQPAAAEGAVELSAGQKTATLDTKFGGEIAPKLGFFARHQITTGYEPQAASYFGFADLTYQLPLEGLGVVGELQLQGAKLVPRAGLQYFLGAGDLSGFAAATAGISGGVNGQIVTVLTYQPKLTEEISLVAKLEALNIFADEHQLSSQKFRVGPTINGFSFGSAVDFTEIGQGQQLQLGCNLGGYFSKTF
ncbi:MAG: hypothetical protein AABW48_01545 [Nanoarchaeota archaeon]